MPGQETARYDFSNKKCIELLTSNGFPLVVRFHSRLRLHLISSSSAAQPFLPVSCLYDIIRISSTAFSRSISPLVLGFLGLLLAMMVLGKCFLSISWTVARQNSPPLSCCRTRRGPYWKNIDLKCVATFAHVLLFNARAMVLQMQDPLVIAISCASHVNQVHTDAYPRTSGLHWFAN